MSKEQIIRWQCTCDKCGYAWESRIENPKMCAKCKTQKWDNPPEVEKEHPAVELIRAYKKSVEPKIIEKPVLKSEPIEVEEAETETNIKDLTYEMFEE